MTKENDAPATALSEISDRGLISHLGAGFHPVNAQFDVSTGSLPYPPSNGPWLERLCFLLLRSQGFVPRYFGNPGQKDRGVDLLVTSGDQLFVYQCKNVQSFLPGDMAKALNRFEDEWLKSSGLPKPNKFILCCPSLLREREPNEDWTKLEREFQSRTGVEVEYWHRNFLDETLKSLPDIVAEVFSDQIATLFCECDDWNYDQFSPVVTDSPDRYIKRYQDRKASDRIYVDPDLAAEFTEKLERNGSVLIMGPPGSGKTITTFALAEGLPNRRTYYVTLRESISDNDLVNGFRKRLSRQTIFLVDDCQGRFGQLDSVMNRVNRLLQGRRDQAFFVFLTRTTPTPGDLVRGGEMTEFEDELKQAEAVLRFFVDQRTFRRIIEQTKPEFGLLSDKRLASIYEFTGHDLFLLDEMLETIADEWGIDDLNVQFLFGKTILRYFGKGTVDRPGFMNLAALAQFEIAPRVAGFPIDLETEDAKAAAELVVQAGRPPRYFFLHSSAAELIFRALVKNDGIEDHVGRAASYLIQFFTGRLPTEKTLAHDLAKVIRTRLKLADDEAEEYRLKSTFLADEGISSLIERGFGTLPLNLLAEVVIILRSTASAALGRYQDLIRSKVEDGTALELAMSCPFWESSHFLLTIKRTDPQLLKLLRNQVSAYGLRSLAQATEFQNFLMLFSMVAESEDAEWRESLSAIPDDEIEAMIQRTINTGRSVGTLSLALRELKQNDEALLTQLEEKIGAARFLHLIAANGSIPELFRVIQYSSLPMAAKLIAALEDPLLDQLVEQTISSGRSIGTINFTLRELKQNAEALLTRLEEKIGAARFLRLIVANGSIPELFRVIQYSSLPMAEKLIAALDDPLLDQLVERTISSRRSIGSICWTLRELKHSSEALLTQLEEIISAARLLRLIAASGSISELFGVIQCSSLPMAEKLIAAVDHALLDQLVRHAISSGFSIAWLHGLKQYDKTLLARFQEEIGAAGFLHLIATNGSIVDLFRVIQYSSLPMAANLIAALEDPLLDQLVEQAISFGCSIGNLHWTLRELKQSGEASLTWLEERVGTARFLRLIAANGSIFEFFRMIQYSSLPMAEKLIATVDDALLDQLVEQTISSGRTISNLHWTLRELEKNDKTLLLRLEEKIGAARFRRLIAANGSIPDLFSVIQYSSLPMAEKLIAALDDAMLDQVLEQTISSGRSIGSLNWTLRYLKKADIMLLLKLEEKIGAARLLRLIAATGSIPELFRAIQYSSLPMAEKLIETLEDPLLDQLLEQTLSSGRSIGSLHRTLGYLGKANSKLLRKLEEKIGKARWWRLVCSFGSISILVDLLPAMDKSFRQKFVRGAGSLSVENWQKLLLQRDFSELCYFVKNAPLFFSAKRCDFLKPIFVTLIQTGNWKARNTGWSLLFSAEESIAKNHLLKLLYEQIKDTQPSALSFLSFADAAHCVNLLWRLLPAKRKELLDALRRFFAEGKPIHSDPAYLRSARLLFSTLATPQAEPEGARMMLAIGNAPAVAPLCSKATTLDLFLYLWNLYGLWLEWKSPQETSFAGFLRVEIVEATISSLPERFRAAKDEKETGTLIRLTGLLSFLGVTFDRPSAAKDLVSRLPSFDKMIERLDEDRPFIPSFFYLVGLEWLYQKDRGVPAVVWWDELGKANDYPETTAALDYLKAEATKRSRGF
ncbi:MAG TPA: hypothetical protein VJH03_00185 [Blastocatellia bacterium]|nr:hypothetical protein [Blastocatellia bacterium]